MQVKIWKASENRKRSPFLAGPIHTSCRGGGVGVVPEKRGFSTTLLPPRQPLRPPPAPPDPHPPGRYRIRAAAVDQSLSYVKDAEGDVKSQGRGFTLCPWGASTSEKPLASQSPRPNRPPSPASVPLAGKLPSGDLGSPHIPFSFASPSRLFSNPSSILALSHFPSKPNFLK